MAFFGERENLQHHHNTLNSMAPRHMQRAPSSSEGRTGEMMQMIGGAAFGYPWFPGLGTRFAV